MRFVDIVLFFAALIFLAVCYVKKKYRYWEIRGVPTVPSSFPKGNIGYNGKKEHLIVLLKNLYFDLKDKGKPIGGLYLGVTPAVVPLDLDFLKVLLVRDFNCFNDRGLYVNERDDPISANLISLYGDKWKASRNKLTPAFTSGKIKLMLPIMQEKAEKLSDCLNQDIQNVNSEVNIGDGMSRFTMEIIASCAFGIESNSLNNPNNDEFLRMAQLILHHSYFRLFMRFFVTTFRNLAYFLRIQWTNKDAAKFFTKIAKEGVAYREENSIQRNDFFNLMIELKNKGKFSDDPGKEGPRATMNEIITHTYEFIVAGYETSSLTMKYCLIELALNPEIQNRLREEVKTVLEKYNNKITYEALSEMEYFDKVLKETMRKHPPVGMLLRSAVADYKVPKTEIVIEKGTLIMVPILGIHHDPDIYPSPQKFDPDRFSSHMTGTRHPYAYLAFGEGPRNCIGMRFAMMEIKVGISILINNYKFSPGSKIKYPIEYATNTPVLSPLHGCWLKVEKDCT